MSSIKFSPVQEPTGGVKHLTPLRLPRLGQHYQVRTNRMLQLGCRPCHGGLPEFHAGIAETQQHLLDAFPLPATANTRLELIDGQAPLDHTQPHRAPYWQQL